MLSRETHIKVDASTVESGVGSEGRVVVMWAQLSLSFLMILYHETEQRATVERVTLEHEPLDWRDVVP